MRRWWTGSAPTEATPWWLNARPSLDELAQWPQGQLPPFVQHCAVSQEYLRLLGDLDWGHFPEPPLRRWFTRQPEARAHYVAAFLVKLHAGKTTMPDLRKFLVQHPALVWVLGFRLHLDPSQPWGFDAERSLATHRHFSRVLRELPNAALQFLLKGTVQLLGEALPESAHFGDEVSLDTKHIIAWVKENNPKCFVEDRFDKTKQPKGDKDCKFGCKKKSNEHQAADDEEATPPTPTTQGLPASSTLPKPKDGEYYWGYASGVVATKVDGWGEFVLADFTQTFDHADPSYFLPLLRQTEANLGRKPKSGALDKAFDAVYVYEYFHTAGGFAAVPWSDREDHHKTFTDEGLPRCGAGLAMPLKSTFFKQSHCLVPHEVGRFACPLLFPEKTGQTCPIDHKNWQRPGKDQGCITSLPTSIGNRLRHELDRQSPAYHRLLNQRTASERINSQAKALGIERPKLRNYHSIANQNTLIYVLINLKALQRLKRRRTTT
jgi:hypothetical protein